MPTKEFISGQFADLQQKIATNLTLHDGRGRFVQDHWQREAGGGGITMVMENGALIEKGGVNFSAVSGPTPAMISAGISPDASTFLPQGFLLFASAKSLCADHSYEYQIF